MTPRSAELIARHEFCVYADIIVVSLAVQPAALVTLQKGVH